MLYLEISFNHKRAIERNFQGLFNSEVAGNKF